jgi:hypothetical protein
MENSTTNLKSTAFVAYVKRYLRDFDDDQILVGGSL